MDNTTHLRWTHNLSSIPEQGLEQDREATPSERAQIVAAFDLVACESLKVHYRIRPLDHARFLIAGSIAISAVQSCVVTLEPISKQYSETFETEIWPQADLPAPRDNVLDAFAEEPETYTNDTIDVGAIIHNRLAGLVDPYPRAPGAVFAWTDSNADDAEEEGPFSKLRKLRPPGQTGT
jgi:hypothetical protein